MPIEKSLGRHDESGGAVTALLSVIIHESQRHRMGLGGRSDPFNGLDILALRVNRERGAAIHHLAIHNDSARAACTPVAYALGAGKIQAIAQSVAERDTRLDRQLLLFAVNLERDGDLARPH